MTTAKPNWKLHRRRKRHHENAQAAKAVITTIRNFSDQGREPRVLAYLQKIKPFVFEELLLQTFEDRGYRVKRNRRNTKDGGIDGRIFDASGRLILLQAKRIRSAVDPDDVARLSALVRGAGAYGGIFAHTGRTGPKSYRECSRDVVILSGERLVRFVLEADGEALDLGPRQILEEER